MTSLITKWTQENTSQCIGTKHTLNDWHVFFLFEAFESRTTDDYLVTLNPCWLIF